MDKVPSDLAARLVAKFPTELRLGLKIKETSAEYGRPPGHKEIKTMLVQIGHLQRFIAEKEFPMDGERLDVVWRRVVRSVPTYVFEVQVGGDVCHALGKLKHAYDLWNSRIYLVDRFRNE